MNIQELKLKSSEQLITQAEELGIENASTLRKQEILFAILKKVAEKEEITGAGVLHIWKDGWGFLRARESSYLPGQDDIYVSRGHAHIIAENGNFFIYDNSNNQTGKASLNGTYINGNENRLNQGSQKLNDGDNIQIGETKFILKTLDKVINE